MAETGNHWEDLRKQARQLENEIDLKLVSFSKLGTSYSSQRDFRDDGDKVPLLSGEHMFDTMVMEIEQLLSKLTQVNEKMSAFTSNVSLNAGGAAFVHTMQRHRDILQDYTHEYQKTKGNILQFRQREDLLSSTRKDADSYKSGLNRRSELYLKENDHLRNSERLIDDQISIAMATKENLTSQRSSLSQITKKMQDLGNRFPVINSLMQRIGIRKRRDTVILGGLISVCIILLLLWIFR